ncbi:MAG: DUF3488 and transglutaminase-like domain-containing protein [Defluviitaleaceae bacterium]|nr:DUF3488 and transglutaminase-like domain-containing protein [Defluviitaleaceae bacterium]
MQITKKWGNWRDTIFLLSVGVVFAWSLTAAIVSTTEFAFPMLTIFINVFLTMVLLRIIFINKFTLLFTLSVIFMAIIILFMNMMTSEYPILGDINAFILQAAMYLNGLIPFEPIFETAITWGLVIGFSLLVFVLGYLVFNFFILFGSGVLLFALVLTSGFFSLNIAFYSFIFSSLAYLVKYLNTQSLSDKSNIGGGSPFVLYALPITVFSVVLAAIVPTPQEGFSDQVYDNLFARPFNHINTVLHDTFRPKYFSLSQTGFGTGNMRRLGGNVTANYNIVMRVQTDESTLYLTGAVLDTYTGYAWLNTFEDRYVLTFYGLNVEQLEQKAGLFNVWTTGEYRDMENGMEYFARNFFIFGEDEYYEQVSMSDIIGIHFLERSLLVDTLDNSTFSVFHTGILTGYAHAVPGEYFVQNLNETITSPTLIPRNSSYTMFYSQIDPSVNARAIMEASHTGFLQYVRDNLNYELLLSMSGIAISYSELLDNYLIPRAQWIHEVYTTLPEHFPQRVVDLAHYITQEATNNYQIARTLESFLHQFEYTLEPGNVPIDRDFVDYFLFDKQMGYCTYYASAFVTMARALGLPTRYVEGFIALGNPGHYTYIRNRQGHAWAEVYFEGFGWQRFDPTPPADTFGAIFASNVAEMPYFDWLSYDWGMAWWEEEMYLQLMAGMGFDGFQAYEAQTIDFGIEGQASAPIPVAEIFAQAVLSVVVLFALAIIARVAQVAHRLASIKKKDNTQAVKDHFDGMLRYLKFFNYEKRDDETAMQFARRAGNFSFELKGQKFYMTDIATIFLKAKYSRHSITAEEREAIEAAVKSMDERVRGYISKRRYLFMKYISAQV